MYVVDARGGRKYIFFFLSEFRNTRNQLIKNKDPDIIINNIENIFEYLNIRHVHMYT